MSQVMIPRDRAVECARRAAKAYEEQGDGRVAAILSGVALAIEAIQSEMAEED